MIVNTALKKRFIIILSVICLANVFVLLGSCVDKKDKSLMLSLGFDEGSGNIAYSAGDLPEARIRYALSAGYAQNPVEPQWSDSAVKGKSLQFDGYSTYLQYSSEDISLKGLNLSLEAWIAPRFFESNETGYREKGNEQLTAIISQWSKATKTGVIFGIHREGNLSFQVGFGDRMFKVWADERIEKYKWTKVTAVYDGAVGELRLYVNGKRSGVTKMFSGAAIAEAEATPLLIGRNNEYSSVGSCARQMFSGLIDEVKIYSRALGDEDVKKAFDKDVPNGIPDIPFENIWFNENLLINDVNRPIYHASAPQHWMNEVHAPVYYNGKYHLFYQFSPFGPYLMQPHWGHWVSDDMVSWKNVKEALSPSDDSVCTDGVWSGGAGYKKDGTPVLFFTSSDISRKYADFSDQNVGIATPKNLNDENLTEWNMYSELVVQQRPGQGKSCGFRDTTVWRVGDEWFLGVGSASDKHAGGTMQVYSTTDDSFTSWRYRGEIMDKVYSEGLLGPLWELPNMVPIKSEDGTDKGKYIFLISPCPPASNDIRYWIGTFDRVNAKFIPDTGYEETRLLDFGRNYRTGPSAFVDPVSGKTVLFTVSKDNLGSNGQYQSGWAHGACLPTELSLDENNELVMKPISTIKNLHGEKLLSMKNASVDEVNSEIVKNGVSGTSLHIRLKMRACDAEKFGINVRQNENQTERAQIYYKDGLASLNTGLAGRGGGLFENFLQFTDGTVSFDIFLDRSLIEVFVNDKFAITNRIFPAWKSDGISLFSVGGQAEVVECEVYRMKSIYSELNKR